MFEFQPLTIQLLLLTLWTYSIDLNDVVAVALEFDGLYLDGIRCRRPMTFRQII